MRLTKAENNIVHLGPMSGRTINCEGADRIEQVTTELRWYAVDVPTILRLDSRKVSFQI